MLQIVVNEGSGVYRNHILLHEKPWLKHEPFRSIHFKNGVHLISAFSVSGKVTVLSLMYDIQLFMTYSQFARKFSILQCFSRGHYPDEIKLKHAE